jgi:hypothetical protein
MGLSRLARLSPEVRHYLMTVCTPDLTLSNLGLNLVERKAPVSNHISDIGDLGSTNVVELQCQGIIEPTVSAGRFGFDSVYKRSIALTGSGGISASLLDIVGSIFAIVTSIIDRNTRPAIRAVSIGVFCRFGEVIERLGFAARRAGLQKSWEPPRSLGLASLVYSKLVQWFKSWTFHGIERITTCDYLASRPTRSIGGTISQTLPWHGYLL